MRFPIGPFRPSDDHGEETRARRITSIAELPSHLARALDGLDDSQLDSPYREGGWTIRQLVHHVADSHANAVIRFRLAVTEDNPTIKPYDQDAWANLGDARTLPVDVSLRLIEGLHGRWAALLESMQAEEFERPLQHPEIGQITVDFLLDMYDWHCRHHVAHITVAREQNGW